MQTILRAVVIAFVALVVLWAFASYLEPGFTGELAADLLRCN
jgi:hypothetical protein